MVLTDTGVGRGALYHHFDGKASLFTAVLEATEARIATVVGAAAAESAGAPLDALRAGCEAWLRLAANDEAVRRIVLVDAPTVVGWSGLRAIDGMRSASALIEAALLIARSEDPMRTTASAQRAIATNLDPLFAGRHERERTNDRREG